MDQRTPKKPTKAVDAVAAESKNGSLEFSPKNGSVAILLDAANALLSNNSTAFPNGLESVSLSYTDGNRRASIDIRGNPPRTLTSNLVFADSENYQPPQPAIVTGAPTPALTQAKSFEVELTPTDAPQLSSIAGVWNAVCRDCGGAQPNSCCAGSQKFDNNCAHFLSDALIRCGFTELLTDSSLYRCDKSNCKIPNARRPVRAREMWAWFQKKAVKRQEKVQWNQIKKNSGWWAVFQLSEAEYWGGHVIVLDTNNWEYYGTCSYPNWDQYAYQW